MAESRSLVHAWGKLFRNFYGERTYSSYLSRTTNDFRSAKVRPKLPDHTRADGSKVTSEQMWAAPQGTMLNELAYLYCSDEIFGWSKRTGVDIKTLLRGIESRTAAPPEMIPADAAKEGCRFSLQDVESFLLSGNFHVDTLTVEHSWALSNACGRLVNPNDVKEFKGMVYDPTLNTAKLTALSSEMGDYLGHCMELYKRYVITKSDEVTVRKEVFIWIETILAPYNLSYYGVDSNPLLTGIIFDFMFEHSVYPSNYGVNLKNLRIFKDSFLPVILDIWEYEPSEKLADERLIIPASAMDFALHIPKLNIYDMSVVIGERLKFLEVVFEGEKLESITQRVIALLKVSNPDLDEDVLLDTLFVYYGIFCTARSRVVPRPSSINTIRGDLKPVDVSQIESFFSELQLSTPDVNVRRSFMGHHYKRVLKLYKEIGLKLPPKCDYIVPAEYGYLNVDFYKQIGSDVLTEEEMGHLTAIRDRVDYKCRNIVSLNSTPAHGSKFSNSRRINRRSFTRKV
ncbi:CPh [Raspberry leaf mottle virus]|uniref:CPh n=3 Tax=Raspberry leaf mottle virus TaxID=326941 RepID=A0MBW8_9CLOS|nr:CPh [Raspberry leaf mottle virus]ABC87279.1 CPh [Raspberry leaf mottle virus]QRG29095.1 CPh [Raspberry leaf mottle virus]